MTQSLRAMRLLAASELRVLFRNKVVLATTLLIPLMMAIAMFRLNTTFVDVGGLAVLLIALIQGLGCYMSLTGTLTARRADSYLKRLRTTTLQPVQILAAVTLPVVAINLLQLVAVLGALAITDTSPVSWPLVVIGVISLEGLFVLAAVATSGVTRTADQAQITAVPFFAVVVGAAGVVSLYPGQSSSWLVLLAPGLASMETVIAGWTAPTGPSPALLGAAMLLWLGIGAVVAKRLFRWHERETRASRKSKSEQRPKR